jgi:chromosome segregation ATPase
MVINSIDLPTYEELISNLADQLGGLSSINQGLGDAARSLVAAHREFADTRDRIELLTASASSILEDVRRLEPAELAANLDKSLNRVSQESSEALGALSERLLTVGGELSTTQEQTTAGFELLTGQITNRNESLSQQISVLQKTLAQSVNDIGEDLIAANKPLGETLAQIKGQQSLLGQFAIKLKEQLETLSQRQEIILPHLIDLANHQADLNDKSAAAAKELRSIRDLAKNIQTTSHSISETTDQLASITVSAIEGVRNDLTTYIAKLHSIQMAGFVIIVILVVLSILA